ncbi:MAG: sulfatase-like hydrolase/transferase [Puniceicoccaceae bacterium]
MMKVLKYLTIIQLLICLAPGIAEAGDKPTQNSDKPNLVLIFTDEHNFRTLGCYRDLLEPDQAFMWGPGNVVETPFIDSIADNGTLFDSMYASAPVCTPSRASMFTGYFGHQLGMPNNSSKPGDGKYLKADVTTIAEVLVDAGYMTGYAGKWHLAENTNKEEFWQPHPVGLPGHNYGFKDNRYMFNGGHDKWKGIDAEGRPYRADKNSKLIGKDKYGQPVFRDDRSSTVKFTTDWITDRTVEFIDEHKDKPFFYVVSIPDPHTPDDAREPYGSMYSDMDFELPRTYGQSVDTDTPSWQQPDGKATKVLDRVDQYFGMVKCIDDNVGRILGKLREEGILENTIIVFSADHGDLYGEHSRMNKGTIHEASAKIPFVIAHGEKLKQSLVPRGKVVEEAANTTDWMPTFLSLMNVDCPDVIGRDLTPLLADNKPDDWNDVTFVKLGFMAAVTSRYKLHLVQKGDPWFLDVKADPDERTNLIDRPEYKPVIKRLAWELKRYMKEADDYNPTIDAKLDALING